MLERAGGDDSHCHSNIRLYCSGESVELAVPVVL